MLQRKEEMQPPRKDGEAVTTALRQFGLPPCLHVPIGARDTGAIESFIGRIDQVLASGDPARAVLVTPYEPAVIDNRLPIWRLPTSRVLHAAQQVWVHVDYQKYRRAYCAAFGSMSRDEVIDHVMNRRVARIKGMQYVRVVPISRAANSSSGSISERYGFAHHLTADATAYRLAHPASIQYADLADLVKMLNMLTGGRFQDAVNEAQALVDPAK